MMSSFIARVAPPPKPSATSASPSSCSAGRGDERRRRQAGAQERGQAEGSRQRERERADKADHGAGDRRRPGEAVDVERRARAGIADGNAGEKAQRVANVTGGGGETALSFDPAHVRDPPPRNG
jgi:hypothetical protein